MISFENVMLFNIQVMREAIKKVGDTCGFDYPYFEVSRDLVAILFLPMPAFPEDHTLC